MEDNGLTKQIDQNEAAKAIETQKIYSNLQNKGKLPQRPPRGIPSTRVDSRQGEMKQVVDNMEKFYRESLRKRAAKKHRQKITTTVLLGASLSGILMISGFKLAEHYEQEKKFNEAVTYMQENYLQNIYDVSGIQIAGYDEKGNVKYNYTPASIAHAMDRLQEEFNLTRKQALLLLYESLGSEAFSEDYFKEYKQGDYYDQLVPGNSPEANFVRKEKQGLIDAVNRFKVQVKFGNVDDNAVISDNGKYYILDDNGSIMYDNGIIVRNGSDNPNSGRSK